ERDAGTEHVVEKEGLLVLLSQTLEHLDSRRHSLGVPQEQPRTLGPHQRFHRGLTVTSLEGEGEDLIRIRQEMLCEVWREEWLRPPLKDAGQGALITDRAG